MRYKTACDLSGNGGDGGSGGQTSDGTFTYQLNGDNYVIVGVANNATSSATELTVPAIYKGKPVTEIWCGFFDYFPNLESAVVEEGTGYPR